MKVKYGEKERYKTVADWCALVGFAFFAGYIAGQQGGILLLALGAGLVGLCFGMSLVLRMIANDK